MMQVNDPNFHNKLQADLDKLRRQLGIAGPDWAQESIEFQVSRVSYWELAGSPF
jgi:hypothetical protein